MAATRGGRRQTTTRPTATSPKPKIHRRHVISATTAALTNSTNNFLNTHDLYILPSQTLTLHSTLASLNTKLKSLITELPIRTPNLSLSPSWFHRLIVSSSDSLNDPRWPLFFRMSKPSFSLLLRLLTPALSSLPVPPSAALAATLYRLAHDASYLILSRLFSLGGSATACHVFFFVCKTIQSKPSFSLFLRLLTPALSSLPVPPSAALAATLYRLAHNAKYLSLSRLFSLGGSTTACHVFFSVCKAIQDKLSHMFEFGSDWSNGGRVVVGFGWMSLPNCCGVLGFDRFPVDGKNLLGENGSLLVQAVVDSEGRFLDVSAGWPSTMKPDKILRHSKLFSGVETTHEYLSGDSFVLGENEGKSIPQYLLGDACLPLLPWLITPYSEPGGDTEKTEFNLVHKKGMDLVETAFGRVKEKWKIVSGKWKEECIEYFPFVVVTCCLLHNYLIKCSEEFEFLEEDVEHESCRKMPVFEGGEEDGEGMRIRNALALHLNRVRLSE